MSVPAFVSFAILQFVGVWGDLLMALLFLGRGENATATVALQVLHGQDINSPELIPAGRVRGDRSCRCSQPWRSGATSSAA